MMHQLLTTLLSYLIVCSVTALPPGFIDQEVVSSGKGVGTDIISISFVPNTDTAVTKLLITTGGGELYLVRQQPDRSNQCYSHPVC